mmetsp:Transcript_445/g.1351  ORF Transcript_445/g.1351 Transcript_445/m.1351 type:complete len:180 (-) Transcript_445:369-908(-)
MSEAALQKNVEDQLARLLSTLSDLDEMRDDLDDDEYQEMKTEALQQMREFQAKLSAMLQGESGQLQTTAQRAAAAMRAAVSEAFSTPEVLRLFAKGEGSGLRSRLDALEQQKVLGKIGTESYTREKAEILGALRRLGNEVSEDEQAWLEQNQSQALKDFQAAQEGEANADVLKAALAKK